MVSLTYPILENNLSTSKCYSQEALVDQILNEKYKAHDALEDSKFLKTHGSSLDNDVDVHCIICKFNLQYFSVLFQKIL